MDALAAIMDALSTPEAVLNSWGIGMRMIGLSYLCAFASMPRDLLAYVGSRGVYPIAYDLARLRRDFSPLKRVFYFPSLFWLHCSDAFIMAHAAVGFAASCVIIAGGEWSRVAFFVCWLMYLSLGIGGKAYAMLFPWECVLAG